MSPALADAARDYLGRVEAIYPHQVLGLVRAGERDYLLNSRDVEWSERTRLHLLALRLREPYLTPERQEAGAAPGSPPPTGSFVCLAASRAGREGLTRAPFGEVVLAAGRSLHLVDPHEPQVAVEIRAGRDQPLNLGEVFRRSARAGIYAGLTGRPRQPAGTATLSTPGGTLIFRTASAGGSVAETRVAPRPGERPAAPAAPAPDPVIAAAPAEAMEPVREEQPAAIAMAAPAPPLVALERVAVAAPPAAAPIPDSPRIARAAPAVLPSTAVVTQPAATGTVPAAYDDYAKAMKTLMALKRSRSVMSVGEMTYVHPAVEVFRRQK